MKLRLCLLAVGALAILIMMRRSDRTSQPAPNAVVPAHNALSLKPGEKEIVAVDFEARTLTVVTPTEVRTFEGVRQAKVTIKEDGKVIVQAKTYGICFEPGFGVAYSEGFGIALDVRLAYWRRWGANLGAKLYPNPSPFVAGSYNLAGIKLPNTSVYIGSALLQRGVVAGIRWRF